MKSNVETNITKRWENGTPHHPKSISLYKNIAKLDEKIGGDFLDLKSGGDGDNGEHLMYLLDVLHELENQQLEV